MLFFAMLMMGAALAAAAGHAGLPGLDDWPSRMRWALALALMFFGIDHLANPARYLPMIEGFVPFPATVVLATGLCEIAGGLGLLVLRLRRAAGILLAIYFVCVFPANIRNALAGGGIEGLPSAAWYYWARLAFQPIAVWWALYAAEAIRWPGSAARASGVGANGHGNVVQKC